MLVEVLLVGVILSYLYAVGFLSINDPWSIAISLAILLGVMVIGAVITRFVAVSVVDGLLGFKDGVAVPKPRERTAATVAGEAGLLEDKLKVLEQFVRERPRDADASLQLSDEYMRRGMVDQFLAERGRILASGVLSPEQAVMALNRMADAEVQRGNMNAALGYIDEVIARYPESEEASRARSRKQRLMQIAGVAGSDTIQS
jgi:tetratricopeptide (TPR) repeat protein